MVGILQPFFSNHRPRSPRFLLCNTLHMFGSLLDRRRWGQSRTKANPTFPASGVGHCPRSMLAALALLTEFCRALFLKGLLDAFRALAFSADFVSVLPTSCVRTLAATQTMSRKELVTNKQCDDAPVHQPPSVHSLRSLVRFIARIWSFCRFAGDFPGGFACSRSSDSASRVSWWRDLVQVKGIQSIGRKRLWHGFLLWTETLEAASKQEQRHAKFHKCKELPGQVQGCCNRCLGGFPAEAPARKRWEQQGVFSTSSCLGIVSKRQNQAELRELLLLVAAVFSKILTSWISSLILSVLPCQNIEDSASAYGRVTGFHTLQLRSRIANPKEDIATSCMLRCRSPSQVSLPGLFTVSVPFRGLWLEICQCLAKARETIVNMERSAKGHEELTFHALLQNWQQLKLALAACRAGEGIAKEGYLCNLSRTNQLMLVFFFFLLCLSV